MIILFSAETLLKLLTKRVQYLFADTNFKIDAQQQEEAMDLYLTSMCDFHAKQVFQEEDESSGKKIFLAFF